MLYFFFNTPSERESSGALNFSDQAPKFRGGMEFLENWWDKREEQNLQFFFVLGVLGVLGAWRIYFPELKQEENITGKIAGIFFG